MTIIIDSHIFLWAASEREKLSATALALLEDTNNVLLLSLASVWELSIKYSAEKLKLPQPPYEFVLAQQAAIGFGFLPITLQHVARVATLPFHHRDPFDRLLAAQSLIENMPLLSADSVFDGYGVTRYSG